MDLYYLFFRLITKTFDFYMGQSNVLVIIDIQKKYEYCWNQDWNVNFMNDLKHLISYYMERDYYIFYVLLPEDDDNRRINDIQELLEDYNKKYEINATHEDKSGDIIKKITDLNINPIHIHICGVDLEQCVYKTIIGLIAKKYREKLILHSKATSCSHSFSKDTKLKEIGSLGIKIE